MTDKEILKRSLYKARGDGFWWDWSQIGSFIINWEIACEPIEPLIFSHDFAKAFWSNRAVWDLKSWKQHLQEMVLYENPLQYLEKFI